MANDYDHPLTDFTTDDVLVRHLYLDHGIDVPFRVSPKGVHLQAHLEISAKREDRRRGEGGRGITGDASLLERPIRDQFAEPPLPREAR